MGKNLIFLDLKILGFRYIVPSGPLLVSRTGAVGWTKHDVTAPKLMTHIDTMKGVGCLKQQDGGHGSRNPLRSV